VASHLLLPQQLLLTLQRRVNHLEIAAAPSKNEEALAVDIKRYGIMILAFEELPSAKTAWMYLVMVQA
jgi:hypothetical protein